MPQICELLSLSKSWWHNEISLVCRANQCLRLLLVPPKEDVNANATPKAAIGFFDELKEKLKIKKKIERE